MKQTWTKLPVYGDGTIKLTPEVMQYLGLVPGEGGAVFIGFATTTKEGVNTDIPSIFAISVSGLKKIAPEEVG